MERSCSPRVRVRVRVRIRVRVRVRVRVSVRVRLTSALGRVYESLHVAAEDGDHALRAGQG